MTSELPPAPSRQALLQQSVAQVNAAFEVWRRADEHAQDVHAVLTHLRHRMQRDEQTPGARGELRD